MNAWQALNLIEKYATCQQCGNELVGNGEGSIEIDNNKFVRSCKCGWKVEVVSKRNEK